ncbi:hypothetical protein BGZ73_008758 [Actinomortierella ambigua]|nr:hypothetical protein BGZ73_008758 [Actinomortierella ambigua]
MLPSRRKRAHHDSTGMSASQPAPSTVNPYGRYRPRGGPLGSATPTPPFKKPTLQRTVSSPFQVLSASVRTTRNPFERLGPPTTASLPVNFTNMHGSGLDELDEDDDDQGNSDEEDRDKDDSSLGLFSFSRPPPLRTSRPDEPGSDYDTEVDDDHDDHDDPDDMLDSTGHQNKRSKLHEALEQSLRSSTITPMQELELPSGSMEGRKKGHTETKSTAHLPLDWTLKSSLSITSQDSFKWCDYGPVTDEIDALHLFNKASLPASLLASSTVATNSEPTCETASSRVQSESVSLSGELEAILTHSTRGLQETLNREHIFFEALPDIVGMVAHDHIGAKHDLDGDGGEDEVSMGEDLDKNDSGHASISSKETSTSARKTTPPPSNVLLFKGRMRVHALFDFLLNYKPEVEEARLYHSPALIASVPFLHGSLKRAQLSKSRQVSKQVPGTDRIERENRIDVQGVILPNQLKKLLEVMAQQQTNTGFTFQATSQTITHGLNLRPLAEKDTDNQSNAEGEPQLLTSQRGQDQYRYNPTSRLFSWSPAS